MKYSNVKGFGWEQGDMRKNKKKTKETAVKTDENKINTCPEYLNYTL